MDALVIEPHALATEAASGTGASVTDIGVQRTCLRLRLIVASLTGTSLSVAVQTAPTSIGPWELLGQLPAVTAIGTKDVILVGARQFVRVAWTLAGTAVTFRVYGQAHALLATPDDVAVFAFPAKAFESIDSTTLASSCLAATEEAATYLAGRFTFPLLSWGQDIVMHVAKMAGYQIMVRRGFQPQGADELIVKGRDDAVVYFKMISKNELYPPGLVDSDLPNVGVTDAYIIEPAVSRWDAVGGNYSDPVFGDPLTRG